MSRCFPFPPPGFEKKHDPVIELIKLQKERERAKKEGKKEKRKEKKEKKEKSRENAALALEKKNKKRHCNEKSQLVQKDGHCSKKRDEETEQLERSSLTEEQGMPSSQYICDSPDSSQNSSKRVKHNAIDVSKNSQGCGLRIRLPLLKQRDTEPSAVVEPPCMPLLKQKESTLPTQAEQRPCLLLPKQKEAALHTRAQQQHCLSLPKQKEAALHSVAEQRPCLSVFEENETAPPTPVEQPCFSGRTDTTLHQEEPKAILNEFSLIESYSGSSKTRREEAKFRDLILNWNPEPLQVEQREDDQDWLFGGTRRHCTDAMEIDQDDSKLHKRGSVLSSWPPRACYLPEADVYALPFVLPF